MALTKDDIINRLAADCELPKAKSREIVESLLETLKDQLQRGEEIMISGFGKFEVKNKAPRRGRNPQTGEAITLDARKVLTFKISGVLRDKINR
jgi:integration host factor subunit alpha